MNYYNLTKDELVKLLEDSEEMRNTLLEKRCKACQSPMFGIVRVHHHTECTQDHNHNDVHSTCRYEDVTGSYEVAE